MTHEKMNLLTGQLQTRLGHRKPHAVHSVTVFCNFKSVLVPPPHVSPRIPIPIIGYVQLQSSIAHTMTHFQTLNGSLFPAVLHITQIFYGTLALQRTQKGLGSCFPCSTSWHSTMEDSMQIAKYIPHTLSSTSLPSFLTGHPRAGGGRSSTSIAQSSSESSQKKNPMTSLLQTLHPSLCCLVSQHSFGQL